MRIKAAKRIAAGSTALSNSNLGAWYFIMYNNIKKDFLIKTSFNQRFFGNTVAGLGLCCLVACGGQSTPKSQQVKGGALCKADTVANDKTLAKLFPTAVCDLVAAYTCWDAQLDLQEVACSARLSERSPLQIKHDEVDKYKSYSFSAYKRIVDLKLTFAVEAYEDNPAAIDFTLVGQLVDTKTGQTSACLLDATAYRQDSLDKKSGKNMYQCTLQLDGSAIPDHKKLNLRKGVYAVTNESLGLEKVGNKWGSKTSLLPIRGYKSKKMVSIAPFEHKTEAFWGFDRMVYYAPLDLKLVYREEQQSKPEV